jgi:hypothetical protein
MPRHPQQPGTPDSLGPLDLTVRADALDAFCSMCVLKLCTPHSTRLGSVHCSALCRVHRHGFCRVAPCSCCADAAASATTETARLYVSCGFHGGGRLTKNLMAAKQVLLLLRDCTPLRMNKDASATRVLLAQTEDLGPSAKWPSRAS